MWYCAECTYIWGISTTHIIWVPLGALHKIIPWHSASPLNTFSDKKPTASWASSSYLGTVIIFRKSFLKISTNLLSFSCSVMSDSLQPQRLQHARLPCPSLSPRVYSNSWSWCCLTISSSTALFSFAFNFSQYQGLFWWLSSSHPVPKYWSLSFSINPSNEYSGLIPLGLTCLVYLQSKGLF